MFNRLMLLTTIGMLVFSLAGCNQPASQEQPAKPDAAASTPAPAEPAGPFYELTKDDITTHPDWTSRNVTILDAKIGDKTNSVVKNFGDQENTRTLPDYYLTVYQKNGLFVYTFKLTGKIQKFEVYETFASKIKDEKLKKLVSGGDLKFMHDTFGMEDKTEEDAENMSTAYIYESKGFAFVKFKVGTNTVNAIRFQEIKKSGTT